jgi:DNA-binding NarL/FixJ family response regulator
MRQRVVEIPSAGPIHVLLVEDHDLLRQGLASIITRDPTFKVVGEAGTARRAAALVESLRPHIAIVDISLPDGDGIAATTEIIRRQPGTRVLILTMHVHQFFARKAFDAGASGYALKSQPPDEILEALRAVARGEAYTSSGVAPAGATMAGAVPGPIAAIEELSPREREVFDLAVRGHSNLTIGKALCISVKTVETHRAHINNKLGVHSTGELIRLAANEGLVVQ